MKEQENSKEKRCIWMKMGVVAYRTCTLDYNCAQCEFDQMLMDKEGRSEETPGIRDALLRLKSLPALERKCRYMLTGDLPYKLCSSNYECWHCEVDQVINFRIESHPFFKMRRMRAVAQLETIRGIKYRKEFWYHEGHTYAGVDGEGRIIAGIDDLAQKVLGKISEINLPSEGSEIRAEEAGIRIKAGDKIIRMRFPINGTLTEKNEKALKNPGLINSDPYNRGWLFRVKVDSDIEEEFGRLVKGENAGIWFDQELDRLGSIVHMDKVTRAANGGEIIQDLSGDLPEQEWERVVREFLRDERR